MEQFHETPLNGGIFSLIERLQDPRLVELADRLVYFERPDFLVEHTSEQMNDSLANRILTDNVFVPWMTLPKALAEIKYN
jgi:hypothetical protein